MVILQGNTCWMAVRVEDCEGKVVGGDRVAKGRFEVGGIVKYYGEGGEVVWNEQVGAFLFPLSEEETFTLSGDIEYQARVVLEDGTVCGSVPEGYYVYGSLSKELIGDGGYGTQDGVVLSAKLVNYVQGGGSGGTSDYNALNNKPSINGVELKGDKTTEELGIVSKETDPTVPQYVKGIKEADIESWNNKVDNTVDNLVNYYLKKDAYSKDEVNQLISAIRSLKKEIVSVLPTENIDENTIYLVPKTSGAGNDYYDEYLYINGNFEFVGTTHVDLSNYVKNTDYATGTKAGIVKANSSQGFYIGAGGDLSIVQATENDLVLKTNKYRPITANNLDKSVKASLTTNTETLTDEEKTKAQSWLGITELVGDINTILDEIVGV